MPYRPNKRALASHARIRAWNARPAREFEEAGIDRDALIQLEHAIRGKVVTRESPDYDKARQESNPAFQSYPELIVYCEVVSDVRKCLAYARERDLWVACRAGGHSTAGYSVNSGIVIDVSEMCHVCVNPEKMRARVGAGTNFGHLNAVLDDYGLHVPGGACEDVCVGGYMQGGGYGYTARRFGMHCDNVLEFRMMLRDGRIVTASETRNPDLFWAVRGGTGGNFGVLLETTYTLHELGKVWGFAWIWDMEHAPALLTELQSSYMKTGAPPELGYMGNLATHDGQKIFALQGLFAGSAKNGREVLAKLRSVAKPILETDDELPYGEMDDWLDNNPYPIPNVTDVGTKEAKQAGYIAKPMVLRDWQAVVDYYRSTPNPVNTAVIEPYGGAINAHPRLGNAFVHRDVDMDFFVDVFWVDEKDKAPAVDWLDGYMKVMAPYFNGHVYQNYPRSTLAEYRSMYFAEAFDTLLRIKNKYDPPPYFFHYQQCIQPYPEGEGPVALGDPCIPVEMIDAEIEYD